MSIASASKSAAYAFWLAVNRIRVAITKRIARPIEAGILVAGARRMRRKEARSLDTGKSQSIMMRPFGFAVRDAASEMLTEHLEAR
jgi:hypothetical protein